MKINIILLGSLIDFISGDINGTVPLIPTQSTTIDNGSFVIYQPASLFDGQKIRTCKGVEGDLHNTTTKCSEFDIVGTMNELFDYKFLNGPYSIDKSSSTYMFGSIRFEYLEQLRPTVNSRFSQLVGNSSDTMKLTYPYMKEPPFPTFPDFGYSVSLIGEPDITKPSSDASIYILGGAKFFIPGGVTSMVKSFSVFNFTDNNWYDLSNTLPKELEQIADQVMINIDNQKLIVFGGYKANGYSNTKNISVISPQYNSLEDIFIYDIQNTSWEHKTVSIDEKDMSLLELRKGDSCTVVHLNNTIYLYSGFYLDSSSKINHLFGMLDIDKWSWSWKQLQINDHKYESSNSTNFDSILAENYMIVSEFDINTKDSVKFLAFDLTTQEINTDIIFNGTYNIQNNPGLNIYNSPGGFGQSPGAIISIAYVLAILSGVFIIFLIYRYFKYRNSKKNSVEYQTSEVWADSSYSKHRNNNTFSRYFSFNVNYLGSVIEHFDTNMSRESPCLEQTVESNWEKNTLLTRQIFDSQTNSFQTSGTLVHQRGKPYNGNAKNTEFSDNWDAYSTY
jgi:hypothetical protein